MWPWFHTFQPQLYSIPYFYADLRSIVFIQQHRGWGTRAKNLGLERLVLAHRWLWPVLQKRYTWVFRTWWKTLKRQYTSNKSLFWRTLPNVILRGFSQSWIFNMRVSERLRSLVFIQKLFFPKNSAAIQGNFSSQVFIYNIILVTGTWSAHGINP